MKYDFDTVISRKDTDSVKWNAAGKLFGSDDGFIFGKGGSCFERINIACPRSILGEALLRLEKAVKAL